MYSNPVCRDDSALNDFGACCNRSKDHVIDEVEPRVSFRLDNSEFEFKDLSARQLEP